MTRQPPSEVAAVSPAAGAWHRVRLPGTAWSVWRDVCVRSAGFPADMVLAICDEPLARSADLAGTDPAGRLAYDKVYAEAAGRLSRAIASTHGDPVFQEAITWQNPGLAQRLQDAGVGTSRRSKDRGRELVIASYLQRYCLKNDTIGLFGPVGWATAGHGPAGLVATPGDQLIARTTTYFEVWAIDRSPPRSPGRGGYKAGCGPGAPGRYSWTGTYCTARTASRLPSPMRNSRSCRRVMAAARSLRWWTARAYRRRAPC